MAESVNALKLLFEEIEALLDPLVQAGKGPQQRKLLFAHLGWDINAITGLPVQELDQALSAVPPLIDAIKDGLDTTDLSKIADLLKASGNAFSSIDRIEAALKSGLPAIPAGKLAVDILNFLTLRYLSDRCPKTYAALALSTLIDLPEPLTDDAQLKDPTSGRLTYDGHRRLVLRLDRLPRLITDPVGLFHDVYWPRGLVDTAAAHQAADRFLPRIADLIQSFGGDATYGIETGPDLDYGATNNAVLNHMLTFRQPLPPVLDDSGDILSSELTLTTGFVAPDTAIPHAGVVVVPSGSVTLRTTADTFFFELDVSVTPGGLLITKSGVFAERQDAGINVTLTVTKLANESGAGLLIGSRDSTHFAIDGIQMLASGAFTGTDIDASLGLGLLDTSLVIKSGDSGGFLQKVLPKDGIRVAFDLTVGWSNKRGLYFNAEAGFETTLPVNINLFGVIKIDSVYLALEAKEDSKKKESAIRAAAATTVQVKLGPVSAIVERFGLQATLSFPEKGGNLGVANLDLGFKPPNGIGLVIKAQVVTGGGYLYFDFEKEQYAGVLQLEIAQKFSLTAVGLLTTKMPDGKPGFSLLVIISVRFDPGIQLGYGFSLNGLGGLLGVNRTVTTEVLRDGLRRGALGSILFPQNVVENAPQIISNLSAIFPPAQDRFLFGPMAIIGWGGSPPILSMEIGIILELPDPVRLIILGRLSVTLPGKSDKSSQTGDSGTDGEEKKQDTPKIKLQLDSLGIIDFGSGDISLDAYLYDSTIGPFTITGGMALRANFGTKPMFLLSVGGYHPAFQVPAGFPSVERVAIGLHKKESGVEVRLQLSAYFALTSNTVQFGAHLDLYVQIAGFVEIIGLLGFDALIQFQPFGVIASFAAMVSVKVGGLTLMAVGLQVNLEGPSPWHVWGKAHFEILGFKQSAEFSAVIGRAEPPPLPPPMDVENELLKELQKLSNWSSQLPAGENPLVTFRDSIPPKDPAATPSKKKVLVHPLAELHINQRLAPLNADPITKYGTTTPRGTTTFTLTANVAAGVKAGSLETKDLSDWFALAQFYVMSDAQKLSAPSFEEKNSGQRVKAVDGFTCGEPVSRGIQAAQSKNGPSDLKAATYLDQVAHLGAAGQAPIRAAGPAKYGDPSWWDQGITLAKTEYRVVGEEEDGTAPKARATRRAGAPSPSSLFEEAMDEMAAVAEPVMSYSAAQARAAQARQRSPRRRTWVVPAIGSKRGGR